MLRQRVIITTLIPIALFTTACGEQHDASTVESSSEVVTGADTTLPILPGTESAESSSADPLAVVEGEAFPSARCEANQAAGTISYLTGFDFAATASILEVLVADSKGYYDELCLDVQIAPSFSTANYPLVAANEAQFSSSGSFSELASFSAANDAQLVALAVDGHVAIDGLMVKPDIAGGLEGLSGATIGVKGKLPPSIAAMLATANLFDGTDFQTVLLDGFNPIAHWEVEGVSAIPGWKSNEPGALQRAGIEFNLHDPADYGIPGSFGLIYTNQTFLIEHPTAAEDFMRATMRGLADAIADPAAASAIAVELINGNGNPNFLSPEGEAFRWATDAQLITDTTPEGSFPGSPDADQLAAEIAAYDAVGVYGEAGAPAIEGRFDPNLVPNLYNADGVVIWPG